MADKITTASVAAAMAGALSMAALTVPAEAETITGMVKCYGISAAGQNSCANAAGTHACAGLSTVDYSGQDYRVVKDGTCEGQGGKLEPFEGINPAEQS